MNRNGKEKRQNIPYAPSRVFREGDFHEYSLPSASTKRPLIHSVKKRTLQVVSFVITNKHLLSFFLWNSLFKRSTIKYCCMHISNSSTFTGGNMALKPPLGDLGWRASCLEKRLKTRLLFILGIVAVGFASQTVDLIFLSGHFVICKVTVSVCIPILAL